MSQHPSTIASLHMRVQELESSLHELRQAERRTALELRLGRVLVRAAAEPDSSASVLSGVCEALGWDWGALWNYDRETDSLHCAEIHVREGRDLKAFADRSRDHAMGSGEGLPGQVWNLQAPTWIQNFSDHPEFPRAVLAEAAGLHAALAVPVVVDGEALGVLEFMHGEILPLDEELLSIVLAIGVETGRLIGRERSLGARFEREQLLGAIMTTALDAIVVMNEQGTIVDWNPAAERTFGHPRAAAIGQVLGDLIVPPTLRHLHFAGLRRYLSTGISQILAQRIEITALHQRGTEFPVELTINEVSALEGRQFAATVRDISQRKREEQLQRFLTDVSEELAHSLDFQTTLRRVARLAVPLLADGCLVDLLDARGGTERVAIEHRDPERVALAWEIERLYPVRDSINQVQIDAIAKREPWIETQVDEAFLQRAARDDRHLAMLRQLDLSSVVSVPLTARDSLLGVITFLAGDSGRRYTEGDVALMRALANRAAVAIDNARLYREAQAAVGARDEFISVASHELRTPLTTVKAAASFLKRLHETDALNPETASRLFQQLTGEIARLERMLGDLLDISRLRGGSLELRPAPANLAEIALQAIERQTRLLVDDRHTITLDASDDVTGTWDADRLDQVVTNLISNAVKYSPDGGEIVVRVRREDDHALLSVHDEGIGISLSDQDLLFGAFARVGKRQHEVSGTGLGLFISEKIVALHGGWIEVESHPGAGSTFTIHLPLTPPM